VPVVRARWPPVASEVRVDGGGAVPALSACGAQAGVTSTVGLPPNARLAARAAPPVRTADAERAATGAEQIRAVGETPSQAGRWPHARRVVVTAAATAKGTHPRFVATDRPDAPPALDEGCVDRGDAEGWLKDPKHARAADRLSGHRFGANRFRLLRHAAADWLLDTLRRWLGAAGAARLQLDTRRRRLRKIGAWVRETATGIHLHLASNHPARSLWHLLTAHHGPP